MGPIGELKGLAVGVEMVEFIPEPHGVVILVEVDDRVAGHGHAGDNLLERSNDDEMAVGQELKVVVGSDDGDVATGAGGGGQGGVEVGSGQLPDKFSGEVHLLQDGIEPVGGRDGEIDEEMAIRKQLDGIGDDAAGKTRIVGPENVTAEIDDSDAKRSGRSGEGEQVQQLDAGLRSHPRGSCGGEGWQLIGREGAGGEDLVGVHELSAITELNDRAHVIESVCEHAGDEEADRTGGRSGGLRPSGEAVACGGAELDGNVAVVG